MKLITRTNLVCAVIAGTLSVAPMADAQDNPVCKRANLSKFAPGALPDGITACASTAQPPQGKNNYGPANAIDADPNTAWVEGDRGDGLGNWIMLRFNQARAVRFIGIQNGYGKSLKTERWEQNGRIKHAVIQTSDGIVERVRLWDIDAIQYIELPREATPTWIRLTILSVYRGTRWRDTALNEFWPAPPAFEPVKGDVVVRGVRPPESEPVN